MPERKDIDEHARNTGNLPTRIRKLEPETILNQRYVIVLRLQQGEMGAVYLAKDRRLGGAVAIKELVVDPAQRESTIARFKRYASQLTKLDHPSIPAVYDFFYAEQFGRFYVVMEYLVGIDLVSLMNSAPAGRLDEKRLTELALEVTDALDYLHAQPTPIIYQNLKPARVMVSETGDRVMLMHWFGRWRTEEKAGAAIGGTMGYAAPELFSGRVVPQSDIYSLGASMFQLLTRFDPQDDPLLVFDFTKNPRPRQLDSRISPEMEQILMQALEYRPEDRFSAGELRVRLTKHLSYLNTGEASSEALEYYTGATVQSAITRCGYCGTPTDVTDRVCPICGRIQSIGLETIASAQKRDEKTNEKPNEPQIYLDENVQFTVYRPSKIKPLKWYPLLAYAHLAEPRDDEDGFDPISHVEKDAERIMRDQNLKDYRQASEDSRVAVPRKGEISFVPFIPGVEFNPSRVSFFWEESVHRQEFRMRASAALEGKTVRGRMSVFLGAILLAEINLSVQVSSNSQEIHTKREKPARPYRRIFPSYSHKDSEIVSQLEHYAQITGDKYMRDVFELRSGQNWKKWMAETIDSADIFQLFWSTNSMRSENVRLEWEHALRLEREHFIRPTYWETPLPASLSENLPPPELRDLHFQHVRPPAYVDNDARAVVNTVPKSSDFTREKRIEIGRDNYQAPSGLEQAEEEQKRAAELQRLLDELRQRRLVETALREADARALKLEEQPSRQDNLTSTQGGARLSQRESDDWVRPAPQPTQSSRGLPQSGGRHESFGYEPSAVRSAKSPLVIVTIVVVLGLFLLIMLLIGLFFWLS